MKRSDCTAPRRGWAANSIQRSCPRDSLRLACALEALIAGGANSHDRLQLIVDLVRTLLPEMERLGVATADDVGIESLLERMTAEVMATSSVVVGHYQVGAWARP